ncbi:MAG: universal stress protein [Conexivisphaerales archaeon]
MIGKIVVGYDGSDHSRAAIDFFKKIDEMKASEVHLVMVIDFASLYSYGVDIPQTIYDSIRTKDEASLEEEVKNLKNEGYNARGVLLEGSPADAIMEYSNKNGISLIIVGSRGLSSFKSLLLGSVSAKLVHESKIPVLVVKK